MAHAILNLLLVFHFAIVPVFYPKPSGIHDGRLTVSNAPTWRHIIRSGDVQQPDGFIVEWRMRFE